MNLLVKFGGDVCVVDVVSINHVLQDHVEQTCRNK